MIIQELLQELKGVASEEEATTEELVKALREITRSEKEWDSIPLYDEGGYLGLLSFGEIEEGEFRVHPPTLFGTREKASTEQVIAGIIQYLRWEIEELRETVAKHNRLVKSLRGTLKNS
ncbi:MAG: hypothetical protein DDT22_01037 [candidate division WS2 bacterium]|nr:hypothetical protein [Candidatus Lithacetigena glycinireducens]